MQTSNTEEMVTISRAEYERFQEQAQVITSLTLQNEWLLEQLKLSRQTMANWLLNVSEKWLRPVYDVLHKQLCKEPVLHADG